MIHNLSISSDWQWTSHMIDCQSSKYTLSDFCIDLFKVMYQLIEVEWCICVSVNKATIGSDNSLLPARHQAIVWTNTGILITGPLELKYNNLFQENAFEDVCKMGAILSRPQCVKLFGALNSFWPNDTIWWCNSGSILVQVMACSLMDSRL